MTDEVIHASRMAAPAAGLAEGRCPRQSQQQGDAAFGSRIVLDETMGYPLSSATRGDRPVTMLSGLVVSDVRVGHGRADGSLLHQAVEQHAPGPRRASVEPEHELIEVVVHVPWINGAVVGAEQPALQQGRDSVDTGQGGVRRFGRTQLNARIVINAIARELFVDGRAVCSHRRNGFDVVVEEPLQYLDRESVNSAHSNASKPLGLKDLHRDGHRHQVIRVVRLGRAHLARFARSAPQGQEGFIDLHGAGQQVTVWTNHRAPEAVEHRPRRLVARQPQNALQPQGADALLLAGDVPGGGEPNAKGRARLSKMVPAVTLHWYRQARQHSRPRDVRPASSATPHAGQTNPRGHRSCSRYAAHASWLANQSSKSLHVAG